MIPASAGQPQEAASVDMLQQERQQNRHYVAEDLLNLAFDCCIALKQIKS